MQLNLATGRARTKVWSEHKIDLNSLPNGLEVSVKGEYLSVLVGIDDDRREYGHSLECALLANGFMSLWTDRTWCHGTCSGTSKFKAESRSNIANYAQRSDLIYPGFGTGDDVAGSGSSVHHVVKISIILTHSTDEAIITNFLGKAVICS